MRPPHSSNLSEAATRGQLGPRTEPLQAKGLHIYMVGIGGCGMSGLARMLRARGAIVSGSDKSRSGFTDTLVKEQIGVGFDQASGFVPEEAELVICSAAIGEDHPQVAAAKARGIPTVNYAQALGWLMLGQTGICVAGTHGKSTTTAMLGCALAAANLEPNVIVGANCPQLGGGFRLGSTSIPFGTLKGKPGLLIVEACEFNRSFHNYSPKIAVITSVEADHLDVYGSLEAVIESFQTFAKLIPPASEGGVLIIADKGAHRREITAGLACKVETIGFSPSADWSVQYDPQSRRTGLVKRGEGLVAAWVSSMPGEHNAMNAATAGALAITAGADPDLVAQNLGQFHGLDRRMTFMGERAIPGAEAGVRVYDDYGHHPTEVETTLRALREFERPETRGGRLICVFQPHQHSRTRFLLDEFASAFTAADLVIVPDIYFVRDSEEERTKVTAGDLVDRLRTRNVQAMHLYPFDAIIEQLGAICRPGDLVVVMGAGPVDAIARGFLSGTRATGDVVTSGRGQEMAGIGAGVGESA